ncbi:hypothetical protein BGW36DRAFT_369041 [Talaromyces proteolyticus]|uniref:NAD(P)-binding domain-containing protein n=1 Tax=Talaromyces proteolyticus TaxID=1131652 RepID=A0AAD4Q4Q4_9EURO|nr:uncharacterized protein BGW36DRAFT_369041 [Talaromyces proteolyticus]KAH8703250.1 hypothetical protein BGW36DRAFT_369041 [Talaromyces proteolyticus]
MKVVLSGSTGRLGGAVLTHCLNHPSITSIILLTRRGIEDVAQNPKVKVIIVKDFTAYDEPTISELQTADAAIWCLGTFNGNEKVDIEFPFTFINTIKSRPSSLAKPFRYVQLGGAFTEPPPEEAKQERSLWFFQNGRRVRGAAEARVLEAAEYGAENEFAVYLVKPGAVLGAAIPKFAWGSLIMGTDELGATMVDLAVHGNEQKVFNNQEIVEHGSRLLGN